MPACARLTHQVEKKGDIARCYCILSSPMMPDGKTAMESGQIIIPGAEVFGDIFMIGTESVAEIPLRLSSFQLRFLS